MDTPEPAVGDDTSQHGRLFTADDPTSLMEGLELAFDYRGDVTLVTREGGEPVEGYIFDRRRADALDGWTVRLVAQDGRRVEVAGADIVELRFTGRDTAEGRSFDTWMRKYVASKLAGKTASIESEPLE